MKLLQRGDILVFEPPFKNFRDVLLKLVDVIMEAVEDIPRLETKLYLDWKGPEAFLKVTDHVWSFKIGFNCWFRKKIFGYL